jgi:hypothetical protein
MKSTANRVLPFFPYFHLPVSFYASVIAVNLCSLIRSRRSGIAKTPLKCLLIKKCYRRVIAMKTMRLRLQWFRQWRTSSDLYIMDVGPSRGSATSAAIKPIPQGSLSCLRVIHCPYPEEALSSPYHHIVSKIHFDVARPPMSCFTLRSLPF